MTLSQNSPETALPRSSHVYALAYPKQSEASIPFTYSIVKPETKESNKLVTHSFLPSTFSFDAVVSIKDKGFTRKRGD